MFELTTGADVLSLQALPVADSVVTDEVTGLARRNRRKGSGSGGGGNKTVCLITLSNSLNGLDVLNILNGFGL